MDLRLGVTPHENAAQRVTESNYEAFSEGGSGNRWAVNSPQLPTCPFSLRAFLLLEALMSTHQRSIKSTDRREAVVVFFDIQLDDMGLTPYEYRVYGRIARRAAGGHHACTESLDSMARGCRMSRPTLLRAIKGLIRRRMIERESKLGETSTYLLTDKSEWVPGEAEIHLPGKREIRGVVNERSTPGKPQIHPLVNERSTKNTRKNTTEEYNQGEREAAALTRLPAPEPAGESNAVSVLLEIFPQSPIHSQEVIDAAGITDLDLWRKIVTDWRDNRYSTRNVTGMRDRYREQLAKQEEANGQNRHRQNNGRQSQQEIARGYNERILAGLKRQADSATGAANPTDANGEQSALAIRR